VIDAAGATLAAALEEGEGLVVPNLAEAEGVLSGARPQPVHPEATPERAIEAARGLIVRGAAAAVVTAGGAGAAFAAQGAAGIGWVPAPGVSANTLVGAGDAFAAGLALRLERSGSLEAAVAFAVVVAAAHVESEAGELLPPRVDALASALHG
jgi:fructose-1-phosphate kinase PfkB-like protein